MNKGKTTMPPSVEAGQVPNNNTSTTTTRKINDDTDDCHIMSSLSAALSGMNTASSPGAPGISQSTSTYLTSSYNNNNNNRLNDGGSSSSSLSSSVTPGPGSLWATSGPLGNLHMSSNQSVSDGLSNDKDLVLNQNNHVQAPSYSSSAYESQRQPQEQPIGTHHHLQSSSSLLFQTNGDLSYGNNHQQQSRNRHTNTNNFHSNDQQQQNQYDFLRNDTKPMGSIREADSSTRYNTSLNPSIDDRTSHQLFNLTGNMNASIPVDSNESLSSSSNRKPIQATSNSSRQWNSFSSPRSIPHTQNTIIESDRSIGNESYDSLRSGSYLNERKLSVGSNLSSMSGRYAHNTPQPQYGSLDRDHDFSSSGYNIPSVKQSNNDVHRYTQNSNFMPPQTAGIPIENHNIITNANPQQQIFYMAVPMQNGGGQVLQPVQMVQLPNGQSTFVVPANPHHTLATGTSTSRPGGSFTIAGTGNKASSIPGSSHQYQNFGVGGKPSSGNVTMVDVGGGVHGNDTMYGLASSHMNHHSHHHNNNRKNNKRGGKGKPPGVVKQPDSVYTGNTIPSINQFLNPGSASSSELTSVVVPSDHPFVEDPNTNSTASSQSPVVGATSDAITALYHSNHRPSLSSLLGHVRRLSRDQVGCRLLQQSLDEDGPRAATAILEEGLTFLTEAMTDPFGNYLFQKILEKVTVEERLRLVETVGPRLVNAALNLHGTRSVQKVVEMSAVDAKEAKEGETTAAEIVTKALAPSAARLCIDSHGNHVIQRILQKLPHEYSKFVFDAVANSVGDVARHRHGCCVIQRCLDSPSSPARSNLVKRIVEKSLDLMQDAYGNYVVQYVLDVCDDEEAAAICQSVVGKISLLAIQKFSSNVMEKCLERSTDRVKEHYLRELSQADKIRELMADPFGNYVVQKALSVATHAQAVRLVEAMHPHLPGMRNTAGGRRIVAKIARRFPRFNQNSGLIEDGNNIMNNNHGVGGVVLSSSEQAANTSSPSPHHQLHHHHHHHQLQPQQQQHHVNYSHHHPVVGYFNAGIPPHDQINNAPPPPVGVGMYNGHHPALLRPGVGSGSVAGANLLHHHHHNVGNTSINTTTGTNNNGFDTSTLGLHSTNNNNGGGALGGHTM